MRQGGLACLGALLLTGPRGAVGAIDYSLWQKFIRIEYPYAPVLPAPCTVSACLSFDEMCQDPEAGGRRGFATATWADINAITSGTGKDGEDSLRLLLDDVCMGTSGGGPG